MSQRDYQPTDDAELDNVEASSPPALATGLWQQVEQLVVEHPKQSLAVAAAAGVVLGWIIKRRP